MSPERTPTSSPPSMTTSTMSVDSPKWTCPVAPTSGRVLYREIEVREVQPRATERARIRVVGEEASIVDVEPTVALEAHDVDRIEVGVVQGGLDRAARQRAGEA